MTSTLKRLCKWQKPSLVVDELIKEWGEDGLIWLDGDGSNHGRWVIVGIDPIAQKCCRGLPQDIQGSNPFQILRNLGPGHWTGWLSYEAAAWVEPGNPWRDNEVATLWIASHDPILKFDLQKRQLWVEGVDKQRLNKMISWLNSLYMQNQEQKRKVETNYIGINIDSWKWLTSKEEFKKQVNEIKALIQAGDLFQANLTACCTNIVPDNIFAIDIFKQLRINCPSPFGGIVIGSGLAAGESIISSSPELFLRAFNNGGVESRPIKGTRPRNINREKDAELAADLICSIKDRAENIMIVDIIRNDLGKVCKVGSISVPQLVNLETYAHVHHLTSIVKGYLNDNQTWVDLLEASWPGGSISGAPKLRACQRLYELEPTARGPYCGSFLRRGWDGNFDSNILIRSIIMKNNVLQVHAGCGIVADSNAITEAEELIWKLMPILKALQ